MRHTSRWTGRTRVVVAVATMSAITLAACGDDEPEENNDAAEGGPVDLTMWVAREQYIPPDSFFDSLEEAYPDINLTVELQPDDALFFQMQRMKQAGEALPDLVQVDSFFAAPMYELGLAIDLTDVVEQWQEEDPELYDLQADPVFFEHDDAIVGLATTGSMDVLYVRSDWLTEAGVEVPIDTWDGVLDALRAIKQNHPDIFPWAMIATRGEGVNWLISQMVASGVEFDGAIPQLTSEAGEYVISFYQQLIRDELTSPEALAWGENESRGTWIGGRAAMILDGMRSSNDIGDALTDGLGVTYPDGWQMILLPHSRSGEPEEGEQLVATRTFHITSDSEHPYEASLVMRHLTETDQAIEAAKSGAVYLQNEVMSSPEFAEIYPYADEPIRQALLEAGSFPSASYFFEVVDLLEQMVQDILQNPDADPAELAEKWQEQLDALAG